MIYSTLAIPGRNTDPQEMTISNIADTRPTLSQVSTPTEGHFHLRPGMMLCYPLRAPKSGSLHIPNQSYLTDEVNAGECARVLVLKARQHVDAHEHLCWTKEIGIGVTCHMAEGYHATPVRIDLRNFEYLLGARAEGPKLPEANFALLVDMGEVLSWDTHATIHTELDDLPRMISVMTEMKIAENRHRYEMAKASGQMMRG